MDNECQQRPCDNCKKVFPNDKVDIHEAYCFRNIKKCPKCDKMVDVNQQQTHDRQDHSNKQCDMCNDSFPPQNFESHTENCPQKPVNCEYCQNTYTLNEISKHKQSCGSRTQPCLICHKNVQIRQFTEHTEKCQRRAQQRRAQVSQDVVRNHHRNEIQAPSRERQNSQNARDKKRSVTKNIIQRPPTKVKPTHIIGPQSIKPIIDPVPISVRLAMKAKDQNRMPLKSKN